MVCKVSIEINKVSTDFTLVANARRLNSKVIRHQDLLLLQCNGHPIVNRSLRQRISLKYCFLGKGGPMARMP